MTCLRLVFPLLAVLAVTVLAACDRGAAPASHDGPRPAQWAVPIEVAGLPNLHRITEDIYRGAQPEEEGFARLKEIGIKTVINLRTFHSDREQCKRHGLDYVHITVQAWEGEDEEVVDFLKVVSDPERRPVFFHCLHGADRTGTMAAIFRLIFEDWSKPDAIEEMVTGGYGFHKMWQNLVECVKNADVAELRKSAGL